MFKMTECTKRVGAAWVENSCFVDSSIMLLFGPYPNNPLVERFKDSSDPLIAAIYEYYLKPLLNSNPAGKACTSLRKVVNELEIDASTKARIVSGQQGDPYDFLVDLVLPRLVDSNEQRNYYKMLVEKGRTVQESFDLTNARSARQASDLSQSDFFLLNVPGEHAGTKLSLTLTANGREFELQSALVYTGNHYMTIYKCGDNWYLYDDLKSDIRKVRSPQLFESQLTFMLYFAKTTPNRKLAATTIAPKTVKSNLFTPNGKRNPTFRHDAFNCTLQCMRCRYGANARVPPYDAQVTQCKRNSCRSLPYCWQHLQAVYHVKLARTTLKENGEQLKQIGLFACDPKQRRDAIIFRRGAEIVPYVGEFLSEKELDARYAEEATAPYALQVEKRFVDAACARGVGSAANHSRKPNAEYQERGARQFPIIVALRPIRNYEEIFVDYGDQYEMNSSSSTSNTRYKLAQCKVKL